ncbi:MAG: hypothetical protein ACOCWO_03610, partial [Candidatus Muiribacteriaceae bacterium]
MKKLGFSGFLKYFSYYNIFIFLTVGFIVVILSLNFPKDKVSELANIRIFPQEAVRSGLFYSIKDFFGAYVFSF